MYGRASLLYGKIILNAYFMVSYEWYMQYQGNLLPEFTKVDFKYKNCIREVVTIFKLKYEKYMYPSGRANWIVILKGQYDFFFFTILNIKKGRVCKMGISIDSLVQFV